LDDLSNWYVRRSRRRFQKPDKISDKNAASQTLYQVLLTLAKLSAPFTPFLSEEIYLGLKKTKMPESVHLCDYPSSDKKLINKSLEEKMARVRVIVAQALAERAAASLKVRQPLAALKIKNAKLKTDKELLDIIKDEVNVKEIIFDAVLKNEIALDKKLTKDLKEEGLARDLARSIQDMRKEAGLTRKDTILIVWQSHDKILSGLMTNWGKYFMQENSAKEIAVYDKKERYLLTKDLKLGESKIKIAIRK